jgi:hypothetical protein
VTLRRPGQDIGTTSVPGTRCHLGDGLEVALYSDWMISRNVLTPSNGRSARLQVRVSELDVVIAEFETRFPDSSDCDELVA